MAYIVVPKPLVPVVGQALFYAGQEPPLHVEAALADFIEEGHFFKHIRRMRATYKRRQAAFVTALRRHLGDRLPVERPPGGMQLVLRLPERIRAEEISVAAAAAGLHARPLSMYALTDAVPNALHLGFAAIPDQRIDPATAILADTILPRA